MSKAIPTTPTAYPLIEPGKRASIAGRTGSGKSSLGCFLLARSPGHWAILNPKGTKAYDNLPDCNTIHGFNLKKIEASLREHKFTNIIPTIQQSSPANLDNFIMWLHTSYENMGLCIDELYTVHTAAGHDCICHGLVLRGSCRSQGS